MDDPKDQEDLRSLKTRLEAARQRHRGGQRKSSRPADSSGMAAGFRVAIDLISGLAVGVAVGIVLDLWLGTSPWFLILFFFLGSGAALMNVMRTAKSLEADRKRRQEEEKQQRAASP